VTTDDAWLRRFVREVPDFPEPGVGFFDITPLLADVDAFRYSVDWFADRFAGDDIDHVAAIESRGFVIAAPIAYRLGVGLVLVRKPDKLPGTVVGRDYDLEYGSDRVEVRADAFGRGAKVLVVDDVLATGGTAAAVTGLVEHTGATVVGVAVLIELAFLGGSGKLGVHPLTSLLRYE
jgi:adenine phosphoribosyltransferase